MEDPLKNKKTLEITSIIDIGVMNGEISPTQYFRVMSALNAVRQIYSWDFIAAAECSIEMYAGNTHKSFAIARTLLESSNVSYVAHAYFVFINTTAMLLANKTIERIEELCEKQNLEFEKYLPLDFKPISYFLTGFMNKLTNKRFTEGSEYAEQIIELNEINIHLNIDSSRLKKIGEIVFYTFMDNNVRCRRLEHSFIDGELLILLHVQTNYKHLQEINSLIFDKCYQAGLSEDLLKLSYFIVPYKNEVLHNEHY